MMEDLAAARTDDDFVAALADELPRVQRVARLLTGDASAAEDLVAEAIARSLPRWRRGDIDALGPYVRTVVVNLASRRWRRRRLSARSDPAALDWIRSADATDAVAVERDRTLRAVLALAPRRRAVVVLRYYDDLSEQQIAEVLGISVGTVKSQLSRSLEQLREHLGTLEGA